jgi:seryl-tRNA synthetase
LFTGLRASLDYRYIRDNAAALQANIVARGSAGFADAHLVSSLYERAVALEFDVAQQRKARNALSKRFGAAKSAEEKAALSAESSALKNALAAAEADLATLKDELEHEGSKLPNLTSPQTPLGPEGSGTVLRVVGEPRVPSPCLDHVSLCHRWQLLDLEAGSSVSGSRFYFLKHELALLEVALVQFALSRLVAKGYTPVLPPDLVKSAFVSACGFQPRDAAGTNSQVYRVSSDGHSSSDLSLVGTAEIPLASMYAQTDLPSSLAERPVKLVGFGHAFRTEAGGQGLAIRGLYRVHQFSKVEIFAITTPADSEKVFDEIVAIQQDLYKELGLCFRVLEIPSEDLGAPAFRKIDMEAWMPGRNTNAASVAAAAATNNSATATAAAASSGPSAAAAEQPAVEQGSYGEISSTSNCTDYQSRRLGIRWTDPSAPREASKQFVHTLNGTAAAIPRLLIALLEQHQQPDGSILIPEALRPFLLGGQIDAIPAKHIFPHREEMITPAANNPPAPADQKAQQKKTKNTPPPAQ